MAANHADIVLICRLLDGLPLAIELAAARCRVLSIASLRSRLDQRLALLVGGGRDVDARQRTLRATVDWSYRLLTPVEQMMFRRLGVFAGNASLNEIEALWAESQQRQTSPGRDEEATSGPGHGVAALEILELLVGASMLRLEEASSGDTRIVMLETLREYAQAKLKEHGEWDHIHTCFARVYLALALNVAPRLHTREQMQVLDHLDQERKNLGVVLSWVLETQHFDVGFGMLAALQDLWTVRGYFTEGRLWLDQLLLEVPQRISGRALALHVDGVLAYRQGDYQAARIRLEESIAICRELNDTHGLARALASLSELLRDQGDTATATPLAEESVELYRNLANSSGLAEALNVLSAALRNQSKYAASRDLAEESLALYRSLGDKLGIASALYRLGILAYFEGESEREQSCYLQSLELRRAIGDQWGVAYALNNLGLTAFEQDHLEQAAAYLHESHTIFQDLGDLNGTAMVLMNQGELARSQGDTTEAQRVSSEALAIYRPLGNIRGMATTLHNLGQLCCRQQPERAETLFKQSLHLYRTIPDLRAATACLAGLATVAFVQGDVLRAARTVASVEVLLKAAGHTLEKLDQATFSETAAAVRQMLGAQRFEALQSEIRPHSVEEALALYAEYLTNSGLGFSTAQL